jgi:hypothetical protein
MHLGQRQASHGQTPTCRYCACTIVLHSTGICCSYAAA